MNFGSMDDWYNDLYQSGSNAAGIDLGNAADALGLNYDESKKTAGTIGGVYLGAGYGAGLGAMGGGAGTGVGTVAGSTAVNAAAGGAAANAAADYVLRPDGTFVKKAGATYAASDEYGGYDQGKRDWFYNQEQANGRGWNKDQFKLAQAQYDDKTRRESRMGEINNWEQSRNPYYSSLYNSQVKAAQATNEQSYGDAMKKMELQHATRGTIGGSQEQYNSATLGAAKALRNSQAAQGIQNSVQGLRRNDQNMAYGMRQSQGSSKYMDALSNAMANTTKTDAGGAANTANLESMRLQDEQSYQNNMSQVYGQATGNGAGGAMNFAGG